MGVGVFDVFVVWTGEIRVIIGGVLSRYCESRAPVTALLGVAANDRVIENR